MTVAVHPDQLTLPAVGNKWEDAYQAWKARHPEIIARYRELARARWLAGQRFSIAKLTEDLRASVPDSAGVFKLDNNHRAYIARDLEAWMPELIGFIHTRKVRGEES